MINNISNTLLNLSNMLKYHNILNKSIEELKDINEDLEKQKTKLECELKIKKNENYLLDEENKKLNSNNKFLEREIKEIETQLLYYIHGKSTSKHSEEYKNDIKELTAFGLLAKLMKEKRS